MARLTPSAQLVSRPRSRRPARAVSEPLEARALLSAAAVLDSGAAVFNGHTYRVVASDTVVPWTAAQAAAQSAGGHLATVNSPAEQSFLESLLTSSGAPTGAYSLGGRVTSTQPLTFGWITGEPFSYTHWDPAGMEPNSGFGAPGSEPVMAMLWTKTPAERTFFRRGFWNDTVERGYNHGESTFDDVNQAGYVIEVDSADQVYEAEKAAVTGAIVTAAHGGYSGSGYVDYQNAAGDAVDFTVTVPSAGRYGLSFRYANGGIADRATALAVNGASLPGGITFTRTGSWHTWNAVSKTLPLLSGANTIRVLANGQSGPNLDSLSIHAVAPPAPITYQAESATLSGPLAVSNHPGFTGTGFADFQHARNDFVEFSVGAATDGPYSLDFRYANGSAGDRPLELRVDNQVVPPTLRFAPTGSWNTWSTTAQSVLLSAGRHTVRLTAVGQSGPNLDALTLRPASTP